MKIMRMTKNDLKRLGERCIRLPFADPLITGCQSVGWNEGIYGWNWTAYTLEGLDGTLLEGCRNYPAWVIEPTYEELEELHEAYQSGNHELIEGTWLQ